MEQVNNETDYQKILENQLEEKFINGWLSKSQFDFISNHIKEITTKYLEQLTNSTPLDEELEIIDKIFSDFLITYYDKNKESEEYSI